MRVRSALAILLFAAGCGGGTVQGSDGGVEGGVDLTKLGTPCSSGTCPSGLEAVTYCGFAGCSGGGQLCSCEIRCAQDPNVCPAGTNCAFVADGPGQVCVKN